MCEACSVFAIHYKYSRHKNNCLNSREMSVFACYKSQKFVKSDSTACENCELRVKKFSLIGIGCFFPNITQFQ